MKSKLDKLNELGELLKSGTITQDEFNKLKTELLNPQKQSEENPKLTELKELLESGVIIQEEFENLKGELLNSGKVTKTDSNQVKKELKKESISAHNKKTPGTDKPLTENEKRILNLDNRGKVKSGRGIGFYALWGMGIFFIYVIISFMTHVSNDNSNSERVDRNENSTESKGEWVPRSYVNRQVICSHSGKSCTKCNGRGWYYSVELVPGHYKKAN